MSRAGRADHEAGGAASDQVAWQCGTEAGVTSPQSERRPGHDIQPLHTRCRHGALIGQMVDTDSSDWTLRTQDQEP